MTGIERAGQQLIDGRWRASTSSQLLPLENPATTEQFALVCRGTAADAHAAVRSARAAFPAWSAAPLEQRVAVLQAAATRLEEQAADLARTISSEVGTTADVALAAQVQRPISVLRALCDAAQDLAWQEQLGTTLVVREPLGVVVAITPWNFPLHQAIAKVGAALAAGCTVVLKPSEVAPLSAYALGDALLSSLADAGAPTAAFNVVTGLGDTVGEALVSSPDVDGISFTGSTAVGRRIGAVAAQTVKRVTLELGGKGPSVVLPGADVAAAARATAARCFTNSGQVCAALSRLIVPRDQMAVAESSLAEVVASLRMGDPADEQTTMGPVVSAAQRARVQELVAQAVADGARVVVGGPEVPVPPTGYFVAPTVFSDVASNMAIAQTEVFGPVLCVLAYDDVEDAVRIANDSAYGLVGAVFGPDDASAAAVAARLRVGTVGVNGGRINVRAPFGGYKQSGNGREFGLLGVEEFLEVKSVNFAAPEHVVWPAA